jgi:hypothetical protein
MKNIFVFSCTAAIIIAASCTSTHIVSSWSEPDKTVTIGKLNKVLVVALFKNETNRRMAEDQMIGYLKGTGVVSYNYLTDDVNKKDEIAIRDKIRADGFDGAVTMRLVDVDKENTYIPGNISSYPSYYRTFGGYYRRSFSYYATPGYYATTKTYTVETNVYSIKEDKIVWTSLTATTDPEGVQKLTEEVTKVVYKQMIKEGFISK